MNELGLKELVRAEDEQPWSTGPARASAVLTWAELAECTCPDFCERDHDTE